MTLWTAETGFYAAAKLRRALDGDSTGTFRGPSVRDTTRNEQVMKNSLKLVAYALFVVSFGRGDERTAER